MSLCLVVAATISVASGASQKPLDQGGPPVTIAFRALGEKGEAVLDLEAADLSLKVNGRTREIGSVELVRLVDEQGATPRPAPLPPAFATNVIPDAGRKVLLVIEDESITAGREQPLKDAVEQVLASLAPGDRVALLITPRGGAITQFSSDVATVRSAMATFSGRALRLETATDVTCRTRETLDGLERLFAGLPGGPPVTVVFFSAGLAGPDDAPTRPGAAPAVCELRTVNFNDLAAVVLSRTDFFYVVHVVEGSGASASLSSLLASGLESLTGVTGGEMIRVTGGNDLAMSRVARETAAYYALTYQPDASDRKAPRWRLNLRTTRDHVRLRVPLEIVNSKAATFSSPDLSPRDMLRVADTFRELPLRMAAYSSANQGDDKVKLVVLVQPAEPSASLESVAAGLFDQKGKLTAQWTGQGDDVTRVPAVCALVARAGTYRLRVAGVDGSGRAGTVDEEVRVELLRADTARLSDLVLGTEGGGPFTPRLEFTSEKSVTGYFEMYGLPGNAQASATLEIARSEDGAALARAPVTIRPANAADDVRLAWGVLPLGAFPAGDYLVRAVVSLDGKPIGHLTRTLHKAK